jgi:hypothetical protein
VTRSLIDGQRFYIVWTRYLQISRFLIMSLTAVVFVLSISCRSLIPLGGSVVGGGVGAIGGPVSGAIGAGIGYGVGELYVNQKENKELQDTVVALTTGDVQKLVDLEIKKKRDSGFFDSMLAGVYQVITWGAVALAAWVLVPVFYTRLIHKEVKKNKVKLAKEKDGT